MEQDLKSLFDFQLFSKNKKLAKLILETQEKCIHELDDDDLELISAAGEQFNKKSDGMDFYDDKC